MNFMYKSLTLIDQCQQKLVLDQMVNPVKTCISLLSTHFLFTRQKAFSYRAMTAPRSVELDEGVLFGDVEVEAPVREDVQAFVGGRLLG